MHRVRAVVVALVCVLAGAMAQADEDWGRFRGPNGTGVSSATNVPLEFGPQTNVRWKTPLPPGHSSPVFTASRIFLTAHTPEKATYTLLVIALERRTGRQLWQREIPRAQAGRRENVNGPASPSPVTDGTNVYAFFQEFGLISFSAEGKERWRMPLGPFNMFYGFGASPILVDGTLTLPVDQVPFEQGLKRYDKNGDSLVGTTEVSGAEPMDRMLRPGVFDAFDANGDGHLKAQEWSVFRAMLASENGLLAIALGGTGDMTEHAIRWRYLRTVPVDGQLFVRTRSALSAFGSPVSTSPAQ